MKIGNLQNEFYVSLLLFAKLLCILLYYYIIMLYSFLYFDYLKLLYFWRVNNDIAGDTALLYTDPWSVFSMEDYFQMVPMEK